MEDGKRSKLDTLLPYGDPASSHLTFHSNSLRHHNSHVQVHSIGTPYLMPSRRRRNITAAHRLPTSRLPVGTPLERAPPPTTLRTSSKSSPNLPSGVDKIHSFVELGSSSSSSTTFRSDEMEQPTMSIAEAKLLRQNERIEQAEVARKATLLSERLSPSKCKAINTNESRESSSPSSGVRLDKYHVASRQPSFSNSVTSASQPTTLHGAAHMERHDSPNLDDIGFQTYIGRKPKRSPAELNAYTKKDEVRQASVEATFDKREISGVFGEELPGPDLLQQATGFHDGQVLFVQHPNGDVSAHQWNNNIYQWVNVGQYSNIRKKIEGQMASDRLRGEMTHQTLQHNTLAYFRTVAKQREALSIGLPFDQNQIDDAPLGVNSLRNVHASGAETLLRATHSAEEMHVSRTVAPAENHAASMPGDWQTTRAWPNPSGRLHIDQASEQIEAPSSSPGVSNIPNKHVPASLFTGSERVDSGEALFMKENVVPAKTKTFGTFQTQVRAQDDPFTMSGHFSNMPGVTTGTSAYRPSLVYPGWYRHLPPGLVPALNTPMFAPVPSVIQSVNDVLHRNRTSLQRLHLDNANIYPSAHIQRSAPRSDVHFPLRNPDSVQITSDQLTPHQHRPAMQYERVAMRNSLIRLGENAKLRNGSAQNNRTVLHDPLKEDLRFADNASNPARSIVHETPRLGATQVSQQRFTPGGGHRFPRLVEEDSEPLPSSSSDIQSIFSAPAGVRVDFGRTTRYEAAMSCLHGDSENRVSGESKVVDGDSYRLSVPKSGFASQDEFYHRVMSGLQDKTPNDLIKTDVNRIWVSLLDNLSSYVEGPVNKRRDYWSQWSQPPEWSIDRGQGGDNSFFEIGWGQPPARVGRDARYRPLPSESRFHGYSPADSYSSNSSVIGSPTGPSIGWTHTMGGHYNATSKGFARY